MKLFNKKIITTILAIALVVGYLSPIFSETVLAAGMEKSVPTSEVGARTKKECGFSLFGMCFPNMSMDSIGTKMAKDMLRNMTTSIVEWINNDFKEGGPSFISDPQKFFVNMADEELGAFIQANSDLKFLCSPFSIDIRLALSFKYSPFKKRIACKFSDVINNATNAITGASINGTSMNSFMNGNFNAGGWNSWLQLTQNPQNNVYGAYLQADAEYGIRIADKQLLKREELGQGKGFLSWKTCKSVPASKGQTVAPEGSELTEDGGTMNRTTGEIKQNCTVQTPGSTIASSLDTSLSSGGEQIIAADEFDEIINALVGKLMEKAIQGGLKSLSGAGKGDTSSYIYGEGQLLEEEQKRQALESSRASLDGEIDKIMAPEAEYYNNYLDAFNLASSTLSKLRSAQACLRAERGNNASREITISEIDDLIQRDIAPELPTLLANVNSSETNLYKLNSMKITANTAMTLNEINGAFQGLNDLVTLYTHSSQAVTQSGVDYARINLKMQPLILTATQASRQCSQL